LFFGTNKYAAVTTNMSFDDEFGDTHLLRGDIALRRRFFFLRVPSYTQAMRSFAYAGIYFEKEESWENAIAAYVRLQYACRQSGRATDEIIQWAYKRLYSCLLLVDHARATIVLEDACREYPGTFDPTNRRESPVGETRFSTVVAEADRMRIFSLMRRP